MWESSEQRGKVRSNVEECRQIWRGLEQPGEAWSSAGKFGASPEQRGGVQGDMERSGDARSKCGERICVLFRLQTGVLP